MTLNTDRIVTLRTKFEQARTELQEALAEKAHGEVTDYTFATLKGSVMLLSLFGKKRDLFVIHNMGIGCNACTMWADGFNGLYPHISDRASFVVSSPNTPDVQAEFAASRGWKFPMISTQGSTFAADMGFTNAAGKAMPGVSAFQKQDSKIVRVSASGFNPTDEFCPVWRLFDLLPEGSGDWRPKLAYGA